MFARVIGKYWEHTCFVIFTGTKEVIVFTMGIGAFCGFIDFAMVIGKYRGWALALSSAQAQRRPLALEGLPTLSRSQAHSTG